MEVYSLSDIGLVRSKNQDSYITVFNENHDLLVLVCDGIGGNKAGEVASYEIVRYFASVFASSKGFKDDEDAITYLKYHARMASDHVYHLSQINDDYEGMGTTITGVLIASTGTYILNAGDSRVYGLIDGSLFQLTKDHTYVNELVERKLITEEEAKIHPKRHYLTRFLGVYEGATCDAYRITGLSDYYLVCSDGLHGYVEDNEIENILREEGTSLMTKAKTLLSKALDAGGYDNVTLVLVKTDRGEQND